MDTIRDINTFASEVQTRTYFHPFELCRTYRPAVSMVHSRLDYTNSLVHGHTNVKRLQSVQNSAARVVLKDNHHLSSGDLLRKLHWLPVQSRIESSR